MKFTKKLSLMLSVFLLFHFAFPRSAYAYLDPATGSYITQIIIAAVIGGLFFIKQYFHRIGTFLKGLFAKEKSIAEDEDQR